MAPKRKRPVKEVTLKSNSTTSLGGEEGKIVEEKGKVVEEERKVVEEKGKMEEETSVKAKNVEGDSKEVQGVDEEEEVVEEKGNGEEEAGIESKKAERDFTEMEEEDGEEEEEVEAVEEEEGKVEEGTTVKAEDDEEEEMEKEDDEEEEDGEELEEEDDEEERQSKKAKKVVEKASLKDNEEEAESEKEEEEESEEEEDEESEEEEQEDEEDDVAHNNADKNGGFTVKANVKPLLSKENRRGFTSKEEGNVAPKKPIRSKPADRPPNFKKPTKASAKSTAIKHAPKKDESNDSKKKNKGFEDQQKYLFQRVWDDDDEILLLEGMVNFCSQNDIICSTDMDVVDMGAFHGFVKESIRFDVSKSQLSDKIRRLKKKYLNNARRGKGSSDPFFSKPHDEKVFKLSKKIWAVEPNVDTHRKLRYNARQTSRTFDWSMYPLLKRSFEMVGNQMMTIMPSLEDLNVNELLGSNQRSKLDELEEKWSRLRKEEISLFFKRVNLMSEQVKLFSTFTEYFSSG